MRIAVFGWDFFCLTAEGAEGAVLICPHLLNMRIAVFGWDFFCLTAEGAEGAERKKGKI